MSVSRIETAFRDAVSEGRLALVPFLTAGFPDPRSTVETALALAREGAQALEIGIPFSDPIADGPVIQEASQRALAQGVGMEGALAVVREIRAAAPIPIVLMTYANPVLRFGSSRFAAAAAAAGADGGILTDVPPEELPETWAALRAADLATILLVTPLTRPERLARILEGGSGFLYVVSRAGVTGRGGAAAGLEKFLAGVRARTTLPLAVGFGIEGPEQVRALRGRADGAVIGTALLRAIGAAGPGGAARAGARFFEPLVSAAAGTGG